MDVTDVTFDLTNNVKQVHTLRRKGAGTVMGNEECTVSYNVAVSAEGLERDYVNMVKQGTVKQVRIKVPGLTLNIEGRYKDVGFDVPLDAEIKQRLTFIGKLTE
jgi:hypothetical protein